MNLIESIELDFKDKELNYKELQVPNVQLLVNEQLLNIELFVQVDCKKCEYYDTDNCKQAIFTNQQQEQVVCSSSFIYCSETKNKKNNLWELKKNGFTGSN